MHEKDLEPICFFTKVNLYWVYAKNNEFDFLIMKQLRADTSNNLDDRRSR